MSKKFTKEETAIWVENQKKETQKLSDEITELANSYKTSVLDYLDYLEFSNRFYNYSTINQLLILKQNPQAHFCGSFQFYKDKNYAINKGEKGIKIFVPVKTTYLKIPKENEIELKPLLHATKEEKKQYKNGLVESEEKVNFKLGTVFEVGQTNVPARDLPNLLHYTSITENDYSLQKEALLQYAKNHNIDVEIGSTVSISVRGYYDVHNNSIKISDKLDEHVQVSVLSHELGHAIHHNKKDYFNIPEAHKELQADTFDILLSKQLNIEIGDNRISHLKQTLDELGEDDNIIDIISPVMSVQKDVVRELKTIVDDLQLNYNRDLTEQEYKDVIKFLKCSYEDYKIEKDKIIYYSDTDDLIGYPPKDYYSYRALYYHEFAYRLAAELEIIKYIDDLHRYVSPKTCENLTTQNPKFQKEYTRLLQQLEENKEVDLDNDGVPDRIDIDDTRNAVQDVKDLDIIKNSASKELEEENTVVKKRKSLGR